MHGLPVVRRWHVVHRRGKQLLPLAQAFRDFVCAAGARYADASVAVQVAPQTPARTARPRPPLRQRGRRS